MKFKIVAMLLAIFCLSGCAATEPDSRFTVTSLAFYQTKNNLKVCIQAADPEKGAFTVAGEGENFETALQDTVTQLTRSPSFSHCEVLVFSSDVQGKLLEDVFSLCNKKGVPLRASVLFSENPEKLLKGENGTDGYDLVSLAEQTVKNFGFGGHTALFEIKTALLVGGGNFALLNITAKNPAKVTGLKRYENGKPSELMNIEQSIRYAKDNNVYEGREEN